MGPVVEGAGVNLTVMSYDGHIDVGLLAAAVLVPDPWVVTRRLPRALDAARGRRGRRGPRPLNPARPGGPGSAPEPSPRAGSRGLGG